MYLIVGLGNPGKKYDGTRHNIGFNIINYVADKEGIKLKKIKHKSLIGEFFLNGEKVILAKPQTYMNNSGEAVRSIVEYYNIDLENVLIVYDDIDTDIGKIRLRKKGSGGTHNGMRNIIYLLNDQKIPRLRFGIGQSEEIKLRNYVLEKFDENNIDIINETIKKSGEAIISFIKEGIDLTMNHYNG